MGRAEYEKLSEEIGQRYTVHVEDVGPQRLDFAVTWVHAREDGSSECPWVVMGEDGCGVVSSGDDAQDVEDTQLQRWLLATAARGLALEEATVQMGVWEHDDDGLAVFRLPSSYSPARVEELMQQAAKRLDEREGAELAHSS